MQKLALHTQCVRALACALFLLPLSARSQAPEASTAWSFMSVRFSTGTSSFIFAGYGHRDVFGMVGLVDNPRSGYTELIGGVGARFALGRTSHAAALAYSRATESRYAQLYWIPSVTIARVTAEATVQLYVPTETSGYAQFGVNPLSLSAPLTTRLSAGASYQLAAQEGGGPGHAAGPMLRLAVPKGAFTLDLLRGLRDFNDEARVSFRATF